MKENKNFFAVDLGATSGRTILGSIEDGKLMQRELTRFPNQIIQLGGHFYWDIYALYNEIIRGLKVVAKEGIQIASIGIDTWGVDFVCVGEDGALLRNPYSYRDPHTEGAMDEYFRLVPKEKVYDKTGIQFMNFNSLFQLATLRRNNDSALNAAHKVLFMPDALSYMLTGEAVCEYTILSTSQILNPRTRRVDPELLEVIGLKEELFGRYVNPSDRVGCLTPEVQKMTGLGPVPVVAVAGHDTASAVASVPAQDPNFAYLSCGTWSLLGVETPEAIINQQSYQYNFTNEAGDKLYRLPGSLPMIQDDDVNAALAPLFPDLGYWNDWTEYLANIQNPVTFGGRTIPGFNTFITDYYHGSDYNGYTGIEGAINAGAIDPYDYTDALNAAGRQYYEDAMKVFYEVYGN